MSSASTRGWGRPCTGTIVTVRRADGLALPVRKEIAPIVSYLCAETERRGYNLVPGWCWGYACRYISGTTTWSNHAWALAVDLNAPNNPYQYTLRTDMPSWMVKMWEAHGFRWGGRYSGKKDPMHYEFMGTPTDARNISASISANWTESIVKNLPVLRRGNEGENVETLVGLLVARDVKGNKKLITDKKELRRRFNADVEQVVKNFQNREGLRADGIVGQNTWTKLLLR